MRAGHRNKGFTLVELVVVIVLSGILATVVAQFITWPVTAFVAQARRGELVDIADGALDRIGRELREALPNSVRIGCGGGCLEFLHAFTGGRYRASPPGDYLNFSPAANDTAFEWLGPPTGSAAIVPVAGGTNCIDLGATCLVVYNTGYGNSDAYGGHNVAAVTVGPPPGLQFSFADSGFGLGQTAFPQASPEQRFYLVDTPVSYLCDLGSGTLRRYQGYSIRANHSDVDSDQELNGVLSILPNPAERALLAERVTGCAFSYTPGSGTRNGVVSIRLELTRDGESVVLHHQVLVTNLP
ncbi:MAG: prepilin-type N-terminal cleavage/methylation domain-containing protein [Gammaproteobacteria bacterium]|nr:prepilin-type N-terminal cleavage/methylation domain-containing protein [Gammaproteobacteria bacterium]MBU1656083.1 prepilin-type N-terminal cleavage/methylation domain-containing protein [Gammaproteobacteria bacterium]MBU1962168.1 prepilin-type N-terminal cleavage/methylation domain-containing protein [Gammaproteobacteria bacterium]